MKLLVFILALTVGLKNIECAPGYGYLGGEELFPVFSPRLWSSELINQCGPEFENQSPINIANSSLKRMTNLKLDNFHSEFSYTVINSIFEIRVKIASGAPVPTISGAELDGAYTFSYMAIRFGKNAAEGSEHRINGEGGNGEFQYIFYKSEFKDYTEALFSGKAEAIAIIAVITENGGDNEALNSLLIKAGTLPTADFRDFWFAENGEPAQNVTYPDSGNANFNELYQLSGESSQKFWTYEGSFTRPLCSEIVRWIVMEEKMTVSNAQYENLRNVQVLALFTEVVSNYSGNYRSIQPLGSRVVLKNDISATTPPPSPTNPINQVLSVIANFFNIWNL